MSAPVKAGTCRINITPPIGGSMAGSISDRRTEGIHDDLFVDALVLSAGEDPVAIVSADIIALHNETVQQIRGLVEQWTGIPGERVLIAATHTHNAPQPGTLFTGVGETDQSYMQELVHKAATAITLAARSLAPARIAVGNGQERSVAFNRRLRLPGGAVAMNIWGRNEELRSRSDVTEGPVDPELGVIRLDREDGTPLACVFSYGLHNTSVGGNLISRDWSGFTGDVLRRSLQAEIPVIHLQGAQGNVNYVNYRDPAQFRGYAVAHQVARVVAGEILKVWAHLRPEAEASIGVRSQVIHIPDRPVTGEDIAWAEDVLKSSGASVWERQFAREVEYVSRRPQVELPVEVMGIKIGDSAIVTNPAELFVEFGLRIKAESPFRTTLISTLTNGLCGYVCTPDAYRLPRAEAGYEPRRTAVTSRVAVDAGDRIVAASLAVLRSM